MIKHDSVHFRFLLSLLSFCLIANAANARPTVASPTVDALAQSRDALKTMSDKVYTETLDNGLRVILYKRDVAPVFSGSVVVRVGGTDEKPGQTGISHMFEHIAFKGNQYIGTKDFAAEKKLLEELEVLKVAEGQRELTEKENSELEKIMEELESLWVIGDFDREYKLRGATGINATTSSELTKYFVDLPKTSFEYWCWIESGRLINPVMRQFYKERDVVMEERRMRFEDDPGGKLYETMLSVAYLKHPYRRGVIGYASDIGSLTATETDEFRKKYYVASNIVVSIVGDVEPKEAMPLIRKYFGRMPEGGPVPRPNIKESPQLGERWVKVEFNASPQMFVAYHKPQYPNPDDAPFSVMLEILAGSSISPLYTSLVKEKQIASSVGYFEGPGSAYPNLVVFATAPRGPHSNQGVLSEFDKALNSFLKRGITDEELQIAKRGIATSYLGSLNSNNQLAVGFASSELLYGNWNSLLDWYDQIVAVTREDVNRVARQYLKPSNRTVALLETASKE